MAAEFSVAEISRYLQSGNGIVPRPADRVHIQRQELQFLLDEIAEYKRILVAVASEVQELYD